MYAQPTQSNNGVNGLDNQTKGIIQSPSKYDEAERVRQRMDNLRKHHNESTEIYNRTQPIINEQIHEETLKYLKDNQVNGTKAKNQKQRAPKKQRTASSSNNNIININNTTTTTTVVQQNNATITSSANGYSPNHHQTPPLSQPQPLPNHMQPQPQQQITLYTTHMQQQQQQPQQTMHMQPKLIQNNHQMQAQAQAQTQSQSQQPQPHFKYQPNNGIYQQSQPTMHNNIQYQQPNQPQHIYAPQQHQMQNQTHINGQPVEMQNQYVVQPHPNQQHFTHQSLNGSHHMSHQQQPNYIGSHTSIAPVHNDLDLTLQAGLECDVDSLIKHEMSVEGQLDFNHELLLKLDNHYPGYNL